MNFSRHFSNKIAIHTCDLYIYNASYTPLAGKNIEHIKEIKLFKIKGINKKKSTCNTWFIFYLNHRMLIYYSIIIIYSTCVYFWWTSSCLFCYDSKWNENNENN
jgi:hypothetical protein